MKPKIEKCLKLLQDGFSLITVSDNKIPNFSWKKQQSKPLDEKEFKKRYYQEEKKYKRKNGEDGILRATEGVGIVTGYDNLEVLDVDLKVFSTAKEQREWFSDFIQFLDDNILDFYDKFCITKTRNNGYHIIFKSKRVEGNRKLAKLKGHKEYILETRGIGGYVFIYDNFLKGKDYSDIQYISDEDRNILFDACKIFNYEEPKKEPDINRKEKKKYVKRDGDITPWEDFNNKNNVWDLIKSDFSVVRDFSDKTVIKRNGSENATSGSIFKDNDLLYIFTGNVPYIEAEKPYKAWDIYVYKEFGGDYSEAAKQAYKDGYGSRIISRKEEIEIEIDNNKIEFPLDIFPKDIQEYIKEASITLNHSIDYMGCSLLWCLSLCVGNSINIEVIPGWHENSNLWIALVGEAGWGKTPSIKRIIHPLQKMNAKEVKDFYQKQKEYEDYQGLSKKDKKNNPEVKKPIKRQFIANDITIEALSDLHEDSKNGIGVFKDELAGWFKDMNKYREGSDLEFWLSCWSGSPIILNRITRKGNMIEKPCISVLGGIQPEILEDFNTDTNKQNGFLDRILICFPDLKSEYLSTKRISYDSIQWFIDVLVGFYRMIKENVTDYDMSGEIQPKTAKMTNDAFELYNKRHREITDMENGELTNQYLKSMLPKQKAYIPRFALLINVFKNYLGSSEDALSVDKNSINKAIKLSNYFIENAKKTKNKAQNTKGIKDIINDNKGKNKREIISKIQSQNPNFDKKKAAQLLDVSVRMVYKYLKN